MARSRRRSSRRSSSGSSALPVLLIAGGAGFALYAYSQTKKKTPLLASGSTYVPPTASGVFNTAGGMVNSFLNTIKNLFGQNSTTGISAGTGTRNWYDLQSALEKYPPSQYPELWSYDPVTQQPQFRGSFDIDIALATE